jgi:hypothetical protein
MNARFRKRLAALTDDAIDRMAAGPRMDRLTRSAANVWFRPGTIKFRCYSTDAHAAIDLAEKVSRAVDAPMVLMWMRDGTACGETEDGNLIVVGGYGAASMALAICRFIIKDVAVSARDPDFGNLEAIEDDK